MAEVIESKLEALTEIQEATYACQSCDQLVISNTHYWEEKDGVEKLFCNPYCECKELKLPFNFVILDGNIYKVKKG